MNLYEWQIKHQVSMQAMIELRAIWGSVDTHPIVVEGRPDSEAFVQSSVVLEGADKGVRLYRNNVGALKDITGRPVRYGLANDSKERNQIIKSADLIGIRPVLITPAHVGHTIGQFVSRECKKPSWRPGDDPAREGPQLAWAQLILSCGGDAAFCQGPGSL
jgi:hypothetical protein